MIAASTRMPMDRPLESLPRLMTKKGPKTPQEGHLHEYHEIEIEPVGHSALSARYDGRDAGA